MFQKIFFKKSCLNNYSKKSTNLPKTLYIICFKRCCSHMMSCLKEIKWSRLNVNGKIVTKNTYYQRNPYDHLLIDKNIFRMGIHFWYCLRIFSLDNQVPSLLQAENSLYWWCEVFLYIRRRGMASLLWKVYWTGTNYWLRKLLLLELA